MKRHQLLRTGLTFLSLVLAACGSQRPTPQAQPAAQATQSEDAVAAATCEELLATPIPTLVPRLLGEAAVVAPLSRSLGDARHAGEDLRAETSASVASWSGAIASRLELESALAALTARDQDHELERRHDGVLAATVHLARWSSGDQQWAGTLTVYDDDEPPAIGLTCAVPGARTLTWSDVQRIGLTSSVVPPEVASTLQSARFVWVELQHDQWAAEIAGDPEQADADRNGLRREVLRAGWVPIPTGEVWYFEREQDHVTVARLDGAPENQPPGTWGLLISRAPTPRRQACAPSEDLDTIDVFVEVTDALYVLAATDGARSELSSESELEQALEERRRVDPDLRRVFMVSELPIESPRLRRAWRIVGEQELEPRMCAEGGPSL